MTDVSFVMLDHDDQLPIRIENVHVFFVIVFFFTTRLNSICNIAQRHLCTRFVFSE